LFLSSATGYNLDTQKFPSSESGIPHIKTANRSLFSLFVFRTNMLSQCNVQCSGSWNYPFHQDRAVVLGHNMPLGHTSWWWGTNSWCWGTFPCGTSAGYGPHSTCHWRCRQRPLDLTKV